MATEKILTLGTIRDYILQWFPDLLWWDGYGKHEPFNKNKSYKHRAGMPNEIRIEFDSEDIHQNWANVNFIGLELERLGYSFAIFCVEGGRSPHIHIYDLDELETLEPEQRTIYRRRFLRKVCPAGSDPDMSLCDEKHLCALEFVPHFKHKDPKKLLAYFWNGRNMGIDFEIKNKILFGKKKRKKDKPYDKKNRKLGDTFMMRADKYVMTNLSFETILEKYNVDFRGTKALCPFHADGNMSLSFSNEKDVWNCFGCDAKGDKITLVRRLENGN